MAVSNSNNPTSANSNQRPNHSKYAYDIVADFRIPDGVEEVALPTLFEGLLHRIENACDDTEITVGDTHGNIFSLKDVPTGENFKSLFRVEPLPGTVRKVIMGFQLHVETSFSTIKHRMLKYLKDNHIFIRIHTGTFSNGIKSTPVAFLHSEHPDTANTAAWKTSIVQKVDSAMKQPNIWKSSDLTSIQDALKDFIVHGDLLDLPINLGKGRTGATSESKQLILTDALTVYVTSKYYQTIQTLFDTIVVKTRLLPQLVPSRLRREKPGTYYRIVHSQRKFMHEHRNIQVANIEPDSFDDDIRPVLEKNPHIHRIYLDAENNKAHISTNEHYFNVVKQWIDSELLKVIHMKKLTYRPHRANFNDASTYGSIFDDNISFGTDTSPNETSTIATNTSRTWNRPPPVKIAYTKTLDEFPPLWTPKSTTTTTTAASTSVVSETTNDVFAEAIRKSEANFSEQLQKLEQSFDVRIKTLEAQMAKALEKVVSNTFTAMVKSNQFATRNDHLLVLKELDAISKTLTALTTAPMFSTLPSINPEESQTPLRHKKPNQSNTPTKLQDHQKPFSSHPPIVDHTMEGSED